MRTPTKNRRGEEGIALLYVAIFLLVSLWFVSLAIDVGKLMAAKTELQAAADAAALAAASAIDPITTELNQPLAKARAAQIAGSNSAYENVKTPVVINPDADVEFPEVRKVKVSVYRDSDHGNSVMLHFAQTVFPAMRWMGVRADATAEVGPLVDICEGLAPFAPEQPPYGDFSKSCDSTYTLTLPVGESQQGNFQFLDYENCAENDSSFTKGGAAELAHYIMYGYDCCFKIGDMTESETKPGLNLGPIRDALRWRFDQDTDTREGICYQEYTGNQSRVFLTPIVNTFDVNGKKMVQVLKFAAFFMKYRPDNLIANGFSGQFIDYVAVGTVDGTIPPDSTSVYGVHLIE